MQNISTYRFYRKINLLVCSLSMRADTAMLICSENHELQTQSNAAAVPNVCVIKNEWQQRRYLIFRRCETERRRREEHRLNLFQVQKAKHLLLELESKRNIFAELSCQL